jgi:hypothetical protein
MFETLSYLLLCLGVFTTVFMFGWQFGCWMVQRDRQNRNRDCYTDRFHEDYYAGLSCKPKTKAKAKKTSKK